MSVCYRPPVFIHANTCSDLGHSPTHPASHGLGAQDPSGSTLPPISWGLLLTIPASRATALKLQFLPSIISSGAGG